MVLTLYIESDLFVLVQNYTQICKTKAPIYTSYPRIGMTLVDNKNKTHKFCFLFLQESYLCVLAAGGDQVVTDFQRVGLRSFFFFLCIFLLLSRTY